MLKASKLDKWNRPIRPMIWIQLTNYKSKPRLDERHRKLTNFLQFVYGKEQHQRTKRENSSKTQNEIEVYCPYERRKQIDRFFLLSFQYWLLLFTMCVWEPIHQTMNTHGAFNTHMQWKMQKYDFLFVSRTFRRTCGKVSRFSTIFRLNLFIWRTKNGNRIAERLDNW